MNSKERVITAAKRGKGDRVPLDIWYTIEVRDMLMKHFSTKTESELWKRLHLDKIVHISPDYIGPQPREFKDGTSEVPPWRYRVKKVNYGPGVYEETVWRPLQDAARVEDLEKYEWPTADWYDFSTVEKKCDQWPEFAILGGYFSPFAVHNDLRGLEQSCIDLVAEPEMTEFMLDKIREFHWDYLCRLIEAGKGKIDITEVTDDFGSQRDLFMSAETYRKWFKPYQRKFVNLAHESGMLVMHHDDGAIRKIIPDLIEVGIDILNPIQHACPGMEMEGLKRDFGKNLCFHGGVDNQQVLPRGSVEDVRLEVLDCMRTLGADGGYILAPCHNIQPVTPIENIVTLYETAWNEGWY